MASRKIKAKARKLAAHLLEVGEDDLEWNVNQWQVKGSPEQAKTIQEIAFAAYTNHPQGMEAGLAAGEVHVRRFVAIDDCGNIINPMVVEGQVHGGLTMGLAPALYEEIVYDENGQCLTGTLADYLLPTAVESPKWETGHTITPSPHHPLGAKGVPATPEKVWRALRDAGVTD